ncbi:putative anaphase-promoting complex subunit 4 WD40 domain [Lyophyllum shimeji]|uniref:Anaphase-promoting complex subunit 4 WD40 domain n=1 Tax=Lyophyllum shimeji TaxID=47721 RepID=A0A9P3UTD4_LYOSH|nr:putative anaphase-promoting complex subunit 4 WD40 domain [Lyophyllum shimeji]
MSANEIPTEPCATETPLPTRKRLSSYASVSSFSSVKRRRMSMLGGDLDLELDYTEGKTLRATNSVDRFVPSRPKTAVPFNATPRTNRISRQFGLSDNRVFTFKGNQENMPAARDESNMYSMLRRSVCSLFLTPPLRNPSSVTENLAKKKQSILALDGPGIPQDPYASPMSWSRKNFIAIACGVDVFYQDLLSRAVRRLCKVDVENPGGLRTIEWGGPGRETTLALGTTTGVVQLWDASRGCGCGALLRMWRESQPTGIGGMDWNNDLLAVGSHDGTISLFDVRAKTEAKRVSVHKGKVLGLKWNTDGTMMASSDDVGMVYIWDKRAGKQLLEEGTQGSKMRHRGPVKALAWCPWKPDLLATGSIYPEGKIRIWSSSSPSPAPTPVESISLNTSVLSLQWSPHARELLSTHGSSFRPPSASARGSASTPSSRTPLKPVFSPLSNAIAVHEYPSRQRLLTITSAHYGPVTHSCLGPEGEEVFTVCPKDETIKKWQVWKKRPETGKKESAFDKWSIR